MSTFSIRRAALDSPDAARLIAALNAELTSAFPEPGANHFGLSAADVTEGDGAFLIAYLDETAVGCGALRRLDAETGELKRMYVDPSARGRGLGRQLVAALEHEALSLGLTTLVLETGARLTRAVELYEGMGYRPIPLFGEYLTSPDTSLCFGKSLV